MNRFHVIDDGAVIVRSKGVFRQTKLFRRGAELFAGFGNGFIGLRARGGTSHPHVSWLEIDVPGGFVEPNVGNITGKGFQ